MLKPKTIFLIDGIGAVISCIVLGVVFINYQALIGLPVDTLYFLATFPLLFLFFDSYAYFQINDYSRYLLKIIASLNAGYCFISIGLLLYNYDAVTTLGWVYFITEIMIIFVLIRLEWKASEE